MEVPKVRLLKAQLFQALENRERDAWKRYWSAFQRYLLAQQSLQEFHDLARALLGPDQLDLHNAFVLALLESACGDQDACGSEEIPGDASGAQQDAAAVKSDESRENDHAIANGRPLSIAISAQESKQPNPKRPFASTTALSPHSIDARDVKAMLHFAHNSDRTLQADEQSAQLLVGLGKAHAANGSSSSSDGHGSPDAKRLKHEALAVNSSADKQTDDVAEALAAIQDVSQV